VLRQFPLETQQLILESLQTSRLLEQKCCTVVVVVVLVVAVVMVVVVVVIVATVVFLVVVQSEPVHILMTGKNILCIPRSKSSMDASFHPLLLCMCTLYNIDARF